MLRRAFLSVLASLVMSIPSIGLASPALVFEPYNGTVFYSEEPDALWFPASLTKMMTAYVAFHALRDGEVLPTTPAICSEKAAKQAGASDCLVKPFCASALKDRLAAILGEP